jgi:hypothetical protein
MAPARDIVHRPGFVEGRLLRVSDQTDLLTCEPRLADTVFLNGG